MKDLTSAILPRFCYLSRCRCIMPVIHPETWCFAYCTEPNNCHTIKYRPLFVSQWRTCQVFVILYKTHTIEWEFFRSRIKYVIALTGSQCAWQRHVGVLYRVYASSLVRWHYQWALRSGTNVYGWLPLSLGHTPNTIMLRYPLHPEPPGWKPYQTHKCIARLLHSNALVKLDILRQVPPYVFTSRFIDLYHAVYSHSLKFEIRQQFQLLIFLCG